MTILLYYNNIRCCCTRAYRRRESIVSEIFLSNSTRVYIIYSRAHILLRLLRNITYSLLYIYCTHTSVCVCVCIWCIIRVYSAAVTTRRSILIAFTTPSRDSLTTRAHYAMIYCNIVIVFILVRRRITYAHRYNNSVYPATSPLSTPPRSLYKQCCMEHTLPLCRPV